MILTHFNYDTVKITYDKPIPHFNYRTQKKEPLAEEIWRGAQVFFDRKGGYATLSIRKGDKSILLSRAKVIEITPWSAKFEAYWWAGHDCQYNKDGSLSKRQKNGFKTLIRADIVCEL